MHSLHLKQVLRVAGTRLRVWAFPRVEIVLVVVARIVLTEGGAVGGAVHSFAVPGEALPVVA
jgi:hypothetical protein